MTSARRLWLLIPLVVLTLTSCAGGAPGGIADPTTETPAGPAVDQGYVDVSEQQGAVEGFVGALEDAALERCEGGEELWMAEGTVVNPTDAVQDYRIYVGFNRNRDTQGLVQVDLASVGVGETRSWSARAPLAGDELSCVLRVERFATRG